MKKWMTAAAALAAVSMGLTACGGGDDGQSGESDSADGGTIELWTAWTEGADTANALTEKIAAWETETGYTVNQTNFTYDMLHEKLIAAAAGGNLPDAVWGLPEYIGEFNKLGILADLTDAWSTWEDAGQVSDAVKSALTIDGTIIGFPYEAPLRAYLVHDDTLAEAGVDVPETWDDVLAVGTTVEDATGSSFYGVSGAGVRAPQELLVYLAQEGLSIAEEQDGGGFKNTWNDDPEQAGKAAEVFQYYQDLISSGAASANSPTYGWEDTDENFATGLTATFVTGNWLSERETSNPDTMGDISVHAIPAPSDGQPATYVEPKPLMVMADSDVLDGSTQLAEAFASEDWQRAAFADRSALASVTADSKWATDFHALMDTAVTYPPVTLSEITQNMIDSLAMALQEGKTAEECASWLSDAINTSLDNAGELAAD